MMHRLAWKHSKECTNNAILLVQLARKHPNNKDICLAESRKFRDFARRWRKVAKDSTPPTVRHAYLLGFIDPISLRMKKVGTFSSRSLSYTYGLMPVELYSISAPSYEEALDKLRDILNMPPFRWLKDAVLAEQVEAFQNILDAYDVSREDQFHMMERWSARTV